MMRTMLTLEQAHTLGLELAHTHTERFVELVRDLDGTQLALPVHGGGWTVGETITHVESVYLRYAGDRRRSDTPQGVGVQNAEDVERLGSDVARSIAAMRETLTFLDAVVPGIEPDQPLPFHAQRATTIAGALGNMVGELLAHGHDIGAAVGTPFTVPSEDTEILWRFTAPLLDGWLRPEAADLTDSWLLRFPFGDLKATLAGGHLDWEAAADGDAHHVIEVRDGATLALTFPYRRLPITDPALALLAACFYDL